jgi:hypothetical protein
MKARHLHDLANIMYAWKLLTDGHLARFLLGYLNNFGSATRTGTEIIFVFGSGSGTQIGTKPEPKY